MGRKPTKCGKKCEQHLFSLKPVRYSAYFSREVQVSFCPALLKHPHIHPTFNRDRKYYTYSFSLKEDQAKYEANDAIYRAEHIKFCHEQSLEKSVMLQPKPRSKSQYCHACKEEYSDYSQHISSPSHKEKLRTNQFSQFIDELVQSNYPPVPPLEPEPFCNSFDDSNALDKEFIISTTTICSSLHPPANEAYPSSPFRSMNGEGAFKILSLLNKPKILKNTIIIEHEDSARNKQEWEDLLFKRVTTMPSQTPKKLIDSPRPNHPINMNDDPL